MCDALIWSADAITSTNWLEVIKALAPLATAFIAFFALRNWQRQDRAKRQAEFLDAILEAAHAYIAEIGSPLTLLLIGQIGLKSRIAILDPRDDDPEIASAIKYIHEQGEQHSKQLLAALSTMQPSVIKLRSLAAKGQVFNFGNYPKCQNAVAQMTRHFDRMEAFTAIISSPTLNWKNDDIRQHLKDMIHMDIEQMQKDIAAQNVQIIEFARETYRRIYGK